MILVLQPYGDPPSVLAPPTTVQVTILANDNPHGLFQFRDDDDSPKAQTIGKIQLYKTLHKHIVVF